MGFVYNKLRGRIVELFGTQEKFAEAIGLSNVSVSKKMTGQTQFSQSDIVLWCDKLDIPLEEAGTYFFYRGSSNV